MSDEFEPERIEKGMLNSTARDGDPQPRARHARPGLEARIREEKDGHCTLYAMRRGRGTPRPGPARPKRVTAGGGVRPVPRRACPFAPTPGFEETIEPLSRTTAVSSHAVRLDSGLIS